MPKRNNEHISIKDALKEFVETNKLEKGLNKVNAAMSKGTVKFFNEAKGFGFISEEDTNKEHFVHISGLIDEIREGDEVEFELKEGKKGLNAVNVKVI